MKPRQMLYSHAEMENAMRAAIKAERTRNAAIADAVYTRALKDGQVAYAHCAQQIAEGIRADKD